jgi:CRP-like cAMP-binding protein
LQRFKAYIDNFLTLSDEAHQVVYKLCTVQNLSKKTHLFHTGEVCHHVHFIEKGFVRVYYLLDGRDITAWFAREGEIASATDSLFTSTSSQYNIQLIEDSEIVSIDYRKIEQYFDRFPEIERLARLMVIDTYLRLDERMKQMLFHSPEERYLSLLKNFPNIINRVPLGYISSYLGITQETLSRIRSKIKF